MDDYWQNKFAREELPILIQGSDNTSWETIYNKSIDAKKFVIKFENNLRNGKIGTSFRERTDIYGFSLWEVKDSSMLLFGNADEGKITTYLIQAWDLNNKTKTAEKIRNLEKTLFSISDYYPLAIETYGKEIKSMKEFYSMTNSDVLNYNVSSFVKIWYDIPAHTFKTSLIFLGYEIPSYTYVCSKQDVALLLYKLNFFGFYVSIYYNI